MQRPRGGLRVFSYIVAVVPIGAVTVEAYCPLSFVVVAVAAVGVVTVFAGAYVFFFFYCRHRCFSLVWAGVVNVVAARSASPGR